MRRLPVLLLLLAAQGCARGQRVSEPAQASATLPSAATERFEPTGSRTASGAWLGERNRCVDRELRVRRLNEFGDPEGTTYAEGYPLGVTATTDRYEYVMRRRPDIGTICTRVPGEAER